MRSVGTVYKAHFMNIAVVIRKIRAFCANIISAGTKCILTAASYAISAVGTHFIGFITAAAASAAHMLIP